MHSDSLNYLEVPEHCVAAVVSLKLWPISSLSTGVNAHQESCFPFFWYSFSSSRLLHLGGEYTPIVGAQIWGYFWNSLFGFCTSWAREFRFIHLTRKILFIPQSWGVMWLIAKLRKTNWENTTLWYAWPSSRLSCTYYQFGFLSFVFCLWKPRK